VKGRVQRFGETVEAEAHSPMDDLLAAAADDPESWNCSSQRTVGRSRATSLAR
jgi:hypothetical protein